MVVVGGGFNPGNYYIFSMNNPIHHQGFMFKGQGDADRRVVQSMLLSLTTSPTGVDGVVID